MSDSQNTSGDRPRQADISANRAIMRSNLQALARHNRDTAASNAPPRPRRSYAETLQLMLAAAGPSSRLQPTDHEPINHHEEQPERIQPPTGVTSSVLHSLNERRRSRHGIDELMNEYEEHTNRQPASNRADFGRHIIRDLERTSRQMASTQARLEQLNARMGVQAEQARDLREQARILCEDSRRSYDEASSRFDELRNRLNDNLDQRVRDLERQFDEFDDFGELLDSHAAAFGVPPRNAPAHTPVRAGRSRPRSRSDQTLELNAPFPLTSPRMPTGAETAFNFFPPRQNSSSQQARNLETTGLYEMLFTDSDEEPALTEQRLDRLMLLRRSRDSNPYHPNFDPNNYHHPPFQGARPHQISRLETRLIIEEDKDDEGNAACTVCLEEVDVGAEVKVMKCKHWFHAGCIDDWLKNKASCPVCRADMRGNPQTDGYEAYY
ncbi:putative RING finger domain protein [Teratosphaeria destructans]|uniref:RING-type E3 ubiquitin transferase n=1 Tax=Teratosphaeria destructans TaxID=418781 RepID=A0A9W7VXL2_9PEZI|nr:putative RING finger domain protein [Teratosphaeria destructans]